MRRLAKTSHFSPKSIALLFTVLLVLSACQQNPSDKPKVTPSNTDPTIDMIDRQITIKMTGADNAEFQGTQKLRIQSPNKDALLNLMVISTDGYIDVGSNLKLSIGIILAAVYKGDGTYTLAPNVALSPDSTPDPKTSPLQTSSRVTFYADNTSTSERTLRAYNDLTKPCPIVIRKKGKAGEVHCPEIRSVEKTTVSFDMTWGE